MTSLDLTGRTAIVTGASRGIGLAISQQLAAAGANVVLTARKQEAADEAAAQVGGNAVGVAAHAVRSCGASHGIRHRPQHLPVIVLRAAVPHLGAPPRRLLPGAG